MYVHQEFPKWLYHPSKPAVVVADAEAQRELGPEWVESPADVLKVAPKEEPKPAPVEVKPKKGK